MTHQLPTLVRRELWEHRYLWIAPVAVAVITVLLIAVIGQFHLDRESFSGFPFGEPIPGDRRRAVFALGVWSVSLPLIITCLFVLWYYATDCLYAERRDRSILFWKSMPVSDTATVLSKLLIALVAAPLIVWLVSLGASIVAGLIWSLRGWAHLVGLGWDTGTWLRVEFAQLLGFALGSLWYAPIIAYLMLVSVWARRAVSLWAVLPILIAAVLEWAAFHTHYIFTALGYRLVLTTASTGGGAPPATAHTDATSIAQPLWALHNVDLWLGLAVAAAFVYAAIRIRRYRDDT